MNAAAQLPTLGLIPSQIQGQVGDVQQNQAQNELVGPILAQQDLQTFANKNIPLPSLIGETRVGPKLEEGGGFSGSGALGGGITGFNLGNRLFPGVGGLVGAIGGGLLGGFG